MNQSNDIDYRKYRQMLLKKRYLFIVLALGIMAAVTITSYLLPERFEARSTVFIEKSVISELVKGIAVTPSFEDKVKVLAYAIRSRALLLKVFDELDMGVDRRNPAQLEKLVRDVQSRIDIKLKDHEGLFIISYSDKNPRVARDFVNTLVRRYIEENISSKREESYGATRFLGEQITTIKTRLEESEGKVKEYRERNSTVLGQNEGMAMADISDLQQKLDANLLRQRQLEQARNQLSKHDHLSTRLVQLRKKRQELVLTYTDQHPEVVELGNEINAILSQQQSQPSTVAPVTEMTPESEKIVLELHGLRDAEKSLRRSLAVRQHQLQSIPAAKTGLDELERERNSQRYLYEQLVARYGQSEVSKQMEVQDKTTTFRVVDPAILPTKPVSPKRVKIILLGIFGGLLASFGFLILLDHLDKSVRNLQSLKTLGIPVLAVVPSIPNPEEQAVARRRDRWFYAAACCCFLMIIATVPIELVRYLSIDIGKSLVLGQRIVKVVQP